MNILVTSIVDLKKSQHNRPHQFIRYLSKRHNITVVSINDWWKGRQGDLEDYAGDFKTIFDNIEYIYLSQQKISPVVQEIFSGKKIRKILKTHDFDVHLNYNTLMSGYFASRKLTTVYDIADDIGAMIRTSPQIPAMLRPFGGLFGDGILKKNISSSARITLTTENLGITYCIPQLKYDIVPNGVDTALFRDRGAGVRAELGIEGFIVGYVGVLREWVDLEPVFTALKALDPQIRLLVVGKEGRFEENVRLAGRLGVEERVIFTGQVPYSAVPKYISAMDVCLIPFRAGAVSENAVPLKLFEYMACEKPVISTNLSGIRKIAGEKVLYASGKNEIQDCILKLYRDEELRIRMGKDGRRFVEENYDWSCIAAKMEEILLSVAMKEKWGK